MTQWYVTVGNIGTIDDLSESEARKLYDGYCYQLSRPEKFGWSRAEYPIVLWEDEEIIAEEHGIHRIEADE